MSLAGKNTIAELAASDLRRQEQVWSSFLALLVASLTGSRFVAGLRGDSPCNLKI